MVYRYIELTNGGRAIVDEADYEFINQWRWQNSGGYARRSEYLRNEKLPNGKHRSVNKVYAMHRVINKTPEGSDTDHLNGHKLDNRRANLRTVTRSQNAINKEGVRGVQFRNDRKRSPYRVYASHDSKEIYVACFRTFEEAKQAYYTVHDQLNAGIIQW